MKIQTTIERDFQKTLKKRGYFCTTIGALLLFLGANVLTIQTLERVGLWIFITAIVCIYLGLKPYSEAKKRIFFPDEIQIDKNNLKYLQREKEILAIPLAEINNISYREKKYQYGILVTKKNNQDLFLPYFSKSAFDNLLESLD